MTFEARRISRGNRVLGIEKDREPGRRTLLDIDVNEYEPLFVLAGEKVLNEGDVPGLEAPIVLEPLPVVQAVAGIAQNGRPPDMLSYRIPGLGENGREQSGRAFARPYVGVTEVAEQHHRTFPLPLVRNLV